MPNECIKASLFSQKADHVHAVNTEKRKCFPFVRTITAPFIFKLLPSFDRNISNRRACLDCTKT